MIRFLIYVYIIMLIAETILSYFPHTMAQEWRRKLKKYCDYTCDPVRRKLPPHLKFDVSPMIVIFLLNLFIQLFYFLW